MLRCLQCKIMLHLPNVLCYTPALIQHSQVMMSSSFPQLQRWGQWDSSAPAVTLSLRDARCQPLCTDSQTFSGYKN